MVWANQEGHRGLSEEAHYRRDANDAAGVIESWYTLAVNPCCIDNTAFHHFYYELLESINLVGIDVRDRVRSLGKEHL